MISKSTVTELSKDLPKNIEYDGISILEKNSWQIWFELMNLNKNVWVRPGFEPGSSRDAEPLDDYDWTITDKLKFYIYFLFRIGLQSELTGMHLLLKYSIKWL